MAGLQIKTTGIEDYLEDGEAFVKALVMGAASAGKTRSASFWPKPIFADCEKGRMSIADRKVPYVEIGSSEEMLALTDHLKRECSKPFASRQYHTLVIDTLDSYQRKVIAERLAAEHKEALSGWADWGYLDAKMSMLVERLLNLPMNIVVNLHIKEKGSHGDDEGPATKEPKLKGDIRDQIANEFDLVGHMATYWEAVNGERTLVRGIKWQPEPSFPILKDRSGRLPSFTPVNFDEQDYEGLLAHFTSGLESMSASENVGEIPMESAAPPAPSNLVGGPVDPDPAKLPKPAAKKAAAKKAATPGPAVAAGVPAAAPAPAAAPVAAPAAPAAAPAVAAPPVAAPAVAKATAAAPPAAALPTNVPAAAKPVPAATPGVEVVEGGASAAPAPAAAAPADVPATTPVVAPEPELPAAEAAPEATQEEVDAAAALAAEALGATPVEEAPAEPVAAPVAPVAAAPVAAAPPEEAPVLCGTPGNLKDGTVNPDPVPGCGGNVRELITNDIDKDRVNIAYLATRTYLCPACWATHKAAS